MKRCAFLLFLLAAAACTPNKSLTVLCTGDVHGAWFDSTYVSSKTRPSLLAVNYYVDSIRKADGKKNVLLLDAGDCLQGDNAAYYYNYVDTTGEHLFSRLVSYMGYDAITVGNHDIETGHAVYDKISRSLASHGIPFMAGNALCNNSRSPYFPTYQVFRRGGLKVLVLGYTNANIPAWLDPSLWSGMSFESLATLVQKDADYLRAAIKPDVTIVCAHTGTGSGDGSVLEDQAMDLLLSLKGVDFVFGAHDHRPIAQIFNSPIGEESQQEIALLNGGARANYLAVGKIKLSPKGQKSLDASLIKVDKNKVDTLMREAFRSDYLAVKAYTLREIGVLTKDLYTRDAYKGMSPLINLIHRVQLQASGANISFVAPLAYNQKISAGVLCYNDLFTIYPFENQLFTLKLRGKEIKDYLEYTYSLMLSGAGSDHVLEIQSDSKGKWSFVNFSFNFDSAAGLNYTVDLSKPQGKRISISGLADGTPFKADEVYTVAMTSYRANGGGDLLIKGAGIAKKDLRKRVVGRQGEIRDYIREFIESNGIVDPALFVVPELGKWQFVGNTSALLSDYKLLFGE